MPDRPSMGVRAVIVGGTGYGAGELIRLLLLHPHTEIIKVSSRSNHGEPVSSVHSHLLGLTQLQFSPLPTRAETYSLCASAQQDIVVVFLALPSGASGPYAAELLENDAPKNLRIIDLSGDLRLKNADTHAATYKEVPLLQGARELFVYSLPDGSTNSCLPTTRYISNPGCLASAAILALRPFTSQPFAFEGTVVVDGKTGTSGAGREPSPTMHHPSRHDDFTAYKVLSHRHEPEIAQALMPWAEEILFVPHLIPTSRGIFVTVYGKIPGKPSLNALQDQLSLYYSNAPFIRIRTTPSRLADVVGTNFCDLSLTLRGDNLVVMAALDNLGKGMVGTAIQNMNLICGCPEHAGLLTAALGPV